nr:NB-ARC domain-containing protein [Fodinicola feengrottensis]
MATERIPADLDERSALLRSSLAGRRALVLLDNARDAAQVRPLIPSAGSLVVVTSRNQLRALSIRDGAHRVTLERLGTPEAVALLGTIVGPERVDAEPAAAAELTRLCDGLPLALAVVAERVQRADSIGAVADALADEKERLDALGAGSEGDPHTDLRAALAWSYQALDPVAAGMFRRLGLHPPNEFGAEVAAALADLPVRQAKEALDRLVAAHMVEQRRPDRYELHDLIRLYAADQARQHDSFTELHSAVGRVCDWYLHATVAADRMLTPHRRRAFVEPYEPTMPVPEFGDQSAAMAWFEREYDTLCSVSRWAGPAAGPPTHGGSLSRWSPSWTAGSRGGRALSSWRRRCMRPARWRTESAPATPSTRSAASTSTRAAGSRHGPVTRSPSSASGRSSTCRERRWRWGTWGSPARIWASTSKVSGSVSSHSSSAGSQATAVVSRRIWTTSGWPAPEPATIKEPWSTTAAPT